MGKKKKMPKRKRSSDDDDESSVEIKPPTKKTKIDNCQNKESNERFSRQSFSELITELLNPNNIDDKLKSNIPETKSTNKWKELKSYKENFIYRLLFHPEKLMYNAKQIMISKQKYQEIMSQINPQDDNEKILKIKTQAQDEKNKIIFTEAYDKMLDEKTNALQTEFFYNCKEILIQNMYTKESDSNDKLIPLKEASLVANTFEQFIVHSKNTYYFRYHILYLIHNIPDLAKIVQKITPEIQFETTITFLNSIFSTESNPTYDINSQLFHDNKFNMIRDFISTCAWFIPMNFNLFLEEHHEPKRMPLSSSINL